MSHPMRDFRRILDDAGRAFGPVTIYPTDTDRRLAAFPPRVSTRPPLRVILAAVAWALLVIALAFGAGWFASKAVANAAATVVQAEAI